MNERTDSDKLRTLAEFFDMYDRKYGKTGTEVQEWLRDLADRLESSDQVQR